MSLSLPSNYEFCGVINSNTPNKRIQKPSSPTSTTNNPSDDNNIPNKWLDEEVIIALVVSIVASFILGVVFALLSGFRKQLTWLYGIISGQKSNVSALSVNSDIELVQNELHKI